MKAKLLALLAVLIVCALAASYDRWHTPGPEQPAEETEITAMKPAPVPDFGFTTDRGMAYDIHALPERGIILHFWASWCAPCAQEMPALLAKVRQANGTLALVAVSIDDNQAQMQQFLHQTALKPEPHIYWVWDRTKDISLRRFNTIRVPETILIDRGRMMTEKIVGDPGWDSAAVRAELAGLVK
jgi:thiol-disulfide isomerase/thioredoxin